MTHRELERRTARLAGHLAGLGLTRGDRGAVLLGNRVEAVESLLAVTRASGVGVPLDPGSPEEELTRLLDDSGAPLHHAMSQVVCFLGVTAVGASAVLHGAVRLQAAVILVDTYPPDHGDRGRTLSAGRRTRPGLEPAARRGHRGRGPLHHAGGTRPYHGVSGTPQSDTQMWREPPVPRRGPPVRVRRGRTADPASPRPQLGRAGGHQQDRGASGSRQQPRRGVGEFIGPAGHFSVGPGDERQMVHGQVVGESAHGQVAVDLPAREDVPHHLLPGRRGAGEPAVTGDGELLCHQGAQRGHPLEQVRGHLPHTLRLALRGQMGTAPVEEPAEEVRVEQLDALEPHVHRYTPRHGFPDQGGDLAAQSGGRSVVPRQGDDGGQSQGLVGTARPEVDVPDVGEAVDVSSGRHGLAGLDGPPRRRAADPGDHLGDQHGIGHG
ncbi:AMP-binding protein [Streptomyces javensis]|uniref:AMP-binding protein n=1 Tax=Streptomyces javensis TaxID=114698 RepID=A0ABS0R558_9ACTN|nr:AMP-binding protein [Streptomyces javensis]